MQLTDYHAKYFAHELTKRCSADSMEKLAGAFVDAQVDLNPHQVEAALFAFKSPLSKGALEDAPKLLMTATPQNTENPKNLCALVLFAACLWNE